jgi:predicted nucleic acid-binding protein
MIVISDSSPVISLSAVGRLDMLRLLYGQAIIPKAVWQEITAAGKGKSGSSEVLHSDWIEVRTVSNRALAEALETNLDPGEAEAIALSVETHPELLLIDERKGRAVAKRMKLNIVGILGILVEARHKGIISELRPLLDALITDAGFRVSRKLYEKVLDTVGETDKSSGQP